VVCKTSKSFPLINEKANLCLVSKKKFSFKKEAKDLSFIINIKEEFGTRKWKISNKEVKKKRSGSICDEDRRERERTHCKTHAHLLMFGRGDTANLQPRIR
jgi:hypothetical protein